MSVGGRRQNVVDGDIRGANATSFTRGRTGHWRRDNPRAVFGVEARSPELQITKTNGSLT